MFLLTSLASCKSVTGEPRNVPFDKPSSVEPCLPREELGILTEVCTAETAPPPECCLVCEEAAWLLPWGVLPELGWLCLAAAAELDIASSGGRLSRETVLPFTPLRALAETPLMGTSAPSDGFCCKDGGMRCRKYIKGCR